MRRVNIMSADALATLGISRYNIDLHVPVHHKEQVINNCIRNWNNFLILLAA